jgi:hypothetical protein
LRIEPTSAPVAAGIASRSGRVAHCRVGAGVFLASVIFACIVPARIGLHPRVGLLDLWHACIRDFDPETATPRDLAAEDRRAFVPIALARAAAEVTNARVGQRIYLDAGAILAALGVLGAGARAIAPGDVQGADTHHASELVGAFSAATLAIRGASLPDHAVLELVGLGPRQTGARDADRSNVRSVDARVTLSITVAVVLAAATAVARAEKGDADPAFAALIVGRAIAGAVTAWRLGCTEPIEAADLVDAAPILTGAVFIVGAGGANHAIVQVCRAVVSGAPVHARIVPVASLIAIATGIPISRATIGSGGRVFAARGSEGEREDAEV